MKPYNWILYIFLTLILHSRLYGQQNSPHREFVYIGDMGFGVSMLVPVVLFSDSSDLMALKTELPKVPHFAKYVFRESTYKITDYRIFAMVDSVIRQSMNKTKLVATRRSTPGELQHYIKYVDGQKVFDIGIYNEAIAIDMVENLIALFKKTGIDQRLISHLERTKARGLGNYD